MRRLACVAFALIASGVVWAAADPVEPQARTRTTAVGIGLHEYRIAVYRSRVRPGRVRLNIENLGEDDHDLQVSGPSGSSPVRATSPEIEPGQRARLTVTLRKRGVYRLICTLGDHAGQGMVAHIRVVR
jgi:hypothetical protein